jgi:hypothetical protein
MGALASATQRRIRDWSAIFQQSVKHVRVAISSDLYRSSKGIRIHTVKVIAIIFWKERSMRGKYIKAMPIYHFS